MIPYNGVSKHLRQRKLARSKRSFSEVLTTCKMSRGWKMHCELRKIRLGGKSRFSDDGLIFRRYTQIMEISLWIVNDYICICIILKSTGWKTDHDTTL